MDKITHDILDYIFAENDLLKMNAFPKIECSKEGIVISNLVETQVIEKTFHLNKEEKLMAYCQLLKLNKVMSGMQIGD